MTQEVLLNEVRANPDDDAPRLVYADWLLDHDDPRGEFIHVQCRLDQLAENDPQRGSLLGREAQLLSAHEAEWRSDLPAIPGFEWGPFRRGFVESMRWVGPVGQDYHQAALGLAQQQPWHLRTVNAALIEGNCNSHYAHALALAFMPMSDWPRLVRQALDVFERTPENDSAQTTIEQAYHQCPQVLHPHLDRLFRIDLPSIRSTWPWHGSGKLHQRFLVDKLRRSSRKEEVVHAWERLLATRDDEMIRLAVEHAPAVYSRWRKPGYVDQERWLNYTLAQEGLTVEEGQVRRLHGEEGWHLIFPQDYFGEGSHRHPSPHPTWTDLSDPTAPMRFGGTGSGTCGFCRGRLHHILTLDPVPTDIGVTGRRPLSLEVCLSCLGWEEVVLFYRYDQSGVPRPRGDFRPVVPRFPVGPLQSAQVRLCRAGRRWAWQAWGCVSRHNLNRVGGPPSWVQSPDYPDCPECGRKMSFLLQLDSYLPMEEPGRSWHWGSGGVGYGLWCDRCRVSAWLWQCT